MSDFHLWIKVEETQVQLMQLNSLMQVYSRDFLDVSPEDFALTAKIHYSEMTNLASLALDLLHRIQAELTETIHLAFSSGFNQNLPGRATMASSVAHSNK